MTTPPKDRGPSSGAPDPKGPDYVMVVVEEIPGMEPRVELVHKSLAPTAEERQRLFTAGIRAIPSEK